MKRMKRNIAATPKEGAKNQLCCPNGYIMMQAVNTAITAEKSF
jgi:hypothetical protein